MALIKTDLVVSIREINDQEFEGFLGFPQDVSEAAERWSLAIGSYAALVTPPSITFETARQALKAQLLQAGTLGAAAFVTGLTQYAAQLALGMQPNFTATPPPTPINLVPVFAAGFGGASAEVVANLLADSIHLWFKTGTAINNSSGATINWN